MIRYKTAMFILFLCFFTIYNLLQNDTLNCKESKGKRNFMETIKKH